MSFEQARQVFDGYTVESIDNRSDYGEIRIISIGMLEGITILVVVHTDRNGVCRIISARQARKDERARYEQKLREAADGS